MLKAHNVAVLLAAYNGEHYLEEQLNSILSQSIQTDIYISLDFSSDGSLETLERFTKKYLHIKLLPYGERYGSAGRNFFRLLIDVDISKYDYIAFSDQDDIWNKNKIESALEKLSIGNFDGYSSNVIAFWPNGKQKVIKKSYPQTDFDYVFESAGPGCTFVMSRELAVAIKQSLLQDLENIDKLWLHDWYCYSFARSHGFKWIIDETPSMAYRQHGGNEVGANSGLGSFFSRAKSILSGIGIAKSFEQAYFLEINHILPVKLMISGRRIDLLRLAFLARECRRKPSEKIMFFTIFLWFSIVGLRINERK